MKQGKLPKSWPKDVVYLMRSVYSKAVEPGLMRLPRPEDAVSISNTTGPYPTVRITAVTDGSHPACGQSGLFASQRLPPDSFILFYLGYVHDHNDTDPKSNYDLSLDREFGVGVDASRMGTEARFINDYRGVAEQPNAEFRDVWVDVGNGHLEKRMAVYVLPAGKSGKRVKGIAKGEEILVSYGKGFWARRNAEQDVEQTGD
jgi:hypothetical protein